MGVLSTASSAADMISAAGQEMAMSSLSAKIGSEEAMNNAKNETILNTATSMAKAIEQASNAGKETMSQSGQ